RDWSSDVCSSDLAPEVRLRKVSSSGISFVLGSTLNAELASDALQAITDVLDLAADVVQFIGTFHHGLGVAMHIAHVAGDFSECGALLVGGGSNLLVEFADLLNVVENLAQHFAGFGGGIHALSSHFDAAFHGRNRIAGQLGELGDDLLNRSEEHTSELQSREK